MNSALLKALLASCSLSIGGCATQPVYVPLPPTHPASPWACESPVPAQSNTLAINKADMVPQHPDWQIPGMRDNELHGHAAGSPTAMDKMGHGMMMHNGHGSMDAGHAPGMVKMEAPKTKVDYAPEGAVHPGGKEPKEHEPELHLDHTDAERRKAPFQAAPVAPPMSHGKDHEGHDMSGMKHEMSEPAEAKEADHSQHEGMDHSAPEKPEEAEDAKPEPQPAMDHSEHGH